MIVSSRFDESLANDLLQESFFYQCPVPIEVEKKCFTEPKLSKVARTFYGFVHRNLTCQNSPVHTCTSPFIANARKENWWVYAFSDVKYKSDLLQKGIEVQDCWFPCAAGCEPFLQDESLTNFLDYMQAASARTVVVFSLLSTCVAYGNRQVMLRYPQQLVLYVSVMNFFRTLGYLPDTFGASQSLLCNSDKSLPQSGTGMVKNPYCIWTFLMTHTSLLVADFLLLILAVCAILLASPTTVYYLGFRGLEPDIQASICVPWASNGKLLLGGNGATFGIQVILTVSISAGLSAGIYNIVHLLGFRSRQAVKMFSIELSRLKSAKPSKVPSKLLLLLRLLLLFLISGILIMTGALMEFVASQEVITAYSAGVDWGGETEFVLLDMVPCRRCFVDLDKNDLKSTATLRSVGRFISCLGSVLLTLWIFQGSMIKQTAHWIKNGTNATTVTISQAVTSANLRSNISAAGLDTEKKSDSGTKEVPTSRYRAISGSTSTPGSSSELATSSIRNIEVSNMEVSQRESVHETKAAEIIPNKVVSIATLDFK